MSAACLADPNRARRQRADGEPLGLGGTETAVLLLTPIAISVAKELVQYVMGDVIGRGLARGGAAAARAVRRLFGIEERSGPDAEPALTLSAAQWNHISELVAGVVLRAGYTEDVAQLLADAVVGTGRREQDEG
ncbi:hypothetical protein ACN265_09290 [Micromonospora sp. WMMD730]|uniref:hypothetical protein n=1 Tax=Micromonospora sp. WMMD730 TaxID=3404128 RepID=UPI003B962141